MRIVHGDSGLPHPEWASFAILLSRMLRSPSELITKVVRAVAGLTAPGRTIRYFLFRAYVPDITGREPEKCA
jgi:hypothetical protein